MNISWNNVWESEEQPLGTREFSNSREIFLIFGNDVKVLNRTDNFSGENIMKNIHNHAVDDITFSKVGISSVDFS